MFKKIIKLVLVLAGVWAIIHRHVIASFLTGSPLAASFASSCEKYPRKSLSTFYLRLV